MFSFFRRRKEADATAQRIIDQGRFLGARTSREAVEMLWGRSLSKNEWDRSASVWERIWQESLKESEMRPPHQLRLAIAAVTDEPVSGKNATESAANAVALLTTAIIKKTESTIAAMMTDLLLVFLLLCFQTTLRSCYREISRRRPPLR
jgi:hypothetical protein